MKLRAGFVSNSSSSSFVIIGFEPQGSIASTIEKLWPNQPLVREVVKLRNQPSKKRGCGCPEAQSNFCAVCGKPMWIPVDIEGLIEDKLQGYIYDLNGKDGISLHKEDGRLLVGVAPVPSWEYISQSAELDLKVL